MKKIIYLGSSILTSLFNVTTAFANHVPEHVVIQRPQVNTPAGLRAVGFSTLGDFVQKTVSLAFIVAIIAVLFMLIWGAFEWITSGGDKEAVGKARGRIINALIGLAVLAVAFALFQLAGQFLGFNILDFTIPTPEGNSAAGCISPRIFNQVTGGCA